MTAARRFVFTMVQTRGNVTFAENLGLAVAAQDDVEVTWVPVRVARERRWERLPVLRGAWGLRAALKARQAIEAHARSRGRPDLYLFHTESVGLLSSGWMGGGPPVVISTDATPLGFDRIGAAYGHDTGRAAGERVKLALYRRAFGHAELIVAFSEWARRSVVDDYGISADRVRVVPPGTDLSLWREDGGRPATEAMQPAPEKVRLLFVGGDLRRKGGELLHEVFRAHLAETCELHLVTKAQQVPEGDGVFVHRGIAPNSEELRALLRSADVFVLPTLADTHSIAGIEAMAAGLPVVSTRVGAIPEVVVDGETGFLVPPGDAVALARALGELVADRELRRAMGERGRERAERLFDASVNGARLLDLCREVAERRPDRAR